MSEYSSHRSLEQDCPVVQMLTNWRWVSPIQARHEVFLTSTGRSRLHVFPSAYLQIWKKAVEQKVQSVFQFEVGRSPQCEQACLFVSKVCCPINWSNMSSMERRPLFRTRQTSRGTCWKSRARGRRVHLLPFLIHLYISNIDSYESFIHLCAPSHASIQSCSVLCC